MHLLKKIMIAGCIVSVLSSCATLINTPRQNVKIFSEIDNTKLHTLDDTVDVGNGYTWRLKRGNHNQRLSFDTGGVQVNYELPNKVSGAVWLNIFSPISFFGLIPDFKNGSAYKYESPVILTKAGLCSSRYENVSTLTPWPNVKGRTKFILEYSPLNVQMLSIGDGQQPGSINFVAGVEVFLSRYLALQAKAGTMIDNYNFCPNGCYTAETDRASVSVLFQRQKIQLTLDAVANRSTYAHYSNQLFDQEPRKLVSIRAVYNYAVGSSLFIEVIPNYSFGWQFAVPLFSENYHKPDIFNAYYSLLSLQWRLPLNGPWQRKMNKMIRH
ncbi:MAG: hypothetical protein ACKVOR_11060 [Flavobacteriales bacterium]